MPRYNVVTKRALYHGVLIDAVDEAAAKRFDGEIVDEVETDSWSDETFSVDEVGADVDEVDLP